MSDRSDPHQLDTQAHAVVRPNPTSSGPWSVEPLAGSAASAVMTGTAVWRATAAGHTPG